MLRHESVNLFGFRVNFWWLILAVSAISLWPFVFYYISGDVRAHFFNLECFGRAMLEGDLYPRWCSYANNGIGSPAMFFYFPLPYIFSLPFYPLTLRFINTEHLLTLQLLLANIVTMIGCMMWFKSHVKLSAAFVLAIFYLWFPYRAEVLFFRTSLAELWCLALFPWVMWSVDKLQENQKHWVLVALFIAMCLLCHIPSALVVCTAVGVMLLSGMIPRRCFGALCLAGMTALLLTAIYWLPALLYKPYVMGSADFDIMTIFPNRQPMLMDFEKVSRARALINSGITLLLTFSFYLYLFSHRNIRNYADHALRVRTALILILLAAFIFFPVSAPLWSWLSKHSSLAEMVMPWRFQSLYMIATIILMMVLINAREQKIWQRPTWRNDIIVFYMLLFFQSMLVFVSFVDKPAFTNYDEFLKRAIVPLKEHRTIWQKKGHSYEEIIASLNTPPSPYRVLKGKGKVSDYKITHNHIVLDVDAKTPMHLELEYLYFPTWKVTSPDNVALTPDDKQGLMQLTIPKGTHHIILSQNAYDNAAFPYLRYLPFASAILWIAMISLAWRRRNHA